MKAALFRELYEIIYKSDDTHILADLVIFPEFHKIAQDFPERFINIHSCEHSALSLCHALSKKAKNVILCVPTPSFAIRWYESLFRELTSSKLPILIIGIPESSLRSEQFPVVHPEIALMHTIPDISIVTPATREEIEFLLTQALNTKQQFYFHFNTLSKPPLIESSQQLTILFEPIEYHHGTQVLCIGIGSALAKAHQAKLHLEEYGYSSSLVSMHTIKPLNNAFLRKSIHLYSAIFVFEDDSNSMSTGTLIGAFIAENQIRKVIFKAFRLNTAPFSSNQVLQKSMDLRSANLEILELMTHFNIIPNHAAWNGK